MDGKVIAKDAGTITSYGYALDGGLDPTVSEQDYAELMASYATVAQKAAESAGNASQSATDASQSATDAETAKGTAQQAATDAQTAQASAQGYAQSAQQSAQSASQSATDAESAKETAVNAVDGFAAGAQQALDSVNQAGNNWKSLAQAQALDSEAYALGTRDGEDVGSSDPAYHNNAKYYAEQTATDRTAAQTSAQTATTKASEAQASAEAAAESARTLTIDATLTQSGQAADAKVVGDKFTEVKQDFTYRDLLQEKAQNEVHVKDESRLAQVENQLESTTKEADNNSLQIKDLISRLTSARANVLVNRLGSAYLVNSLGYAFVENTYTLSDTIKKEIITQTDETAILGEAAASQVYSKNSNKISKINTAYKNTERESNNNALQTADLINDLTKYTSGLLVDASGAVLLDGYGRFFARNVYTISDSAISEIINAVNKLGYYGAYNRFAFDDWKLPVLQLDGVLPALLEKTADKSIEQNVSAGDPPIFYTFNGQSGKIDKMKVQGSSSVKFPKKNYTVTFHDSMVIVDGWERSKKYVVKSNFNDCSQARNVCCAKLWGDIAKTRSAEQRNDLLIDGNGDYLANSAGAYLLGTALSPFNIGGNYGAIDGFPVIITINGQYWGLYAFNVPKDKYMASMDGSGTECIVSCGGYSTTNAEYFKGQATMEPDANDVTDFEVEYSHNISDADILTSINQAISAVMATYSTDQEALEAINQYVDINSAMDYFILTALINNTDGVGKNYLLDTWDGVKWYFVPYDMDMVIGNDKWAGTKVGAPNTGLTFLYLSTLHRLFYVIYHYDRENFISRYKELRAGALSESNIYNVFGSYINNIPVAAYNYEGIRWTETPGTAIKTFDQIVNWYTLRCRYLDAEIAALEGTA